MAKRDDDHDRDSFLVVLGYPLEFNYENSDRAFDDAERAAVKLLEKHPDFVHATILSVPHDWLQNSIIAENRGIVLTTAEGMTMPALDAEDI